MTTVDAPESCDTVCTCRQKISTVVRERHCINLTRKTMHLLTAVNIPNLCRTARAYSDPATIWRKCHLLYEAISKIRIDEQLQRFARCDIPQMDLVIKRVSAR